MSRCPNVPEAEDSPNNSTKSLFVKQIKSRINNFKKKNFRELNLHPKEKNMHTFHTLETWRIEHNIR